MGREMNVATFTLLLIIRLTSGYIYPEETVTRHVKSLNGLWLFQYNGDGFHGKWYERDLTSTANYTYMPVPSSFQDVTDNQELRGLVGWVWYQRQFYMSSWPESSRIFVHFGAADHYAIVWCNGREVGRHEGGHVSFDLEITPYIYRTEKNFLTVAVNNTLTPDTIPQGYVTYPNDTNLYPPGTRLYYHHFTYFDYTGLNRGVFLYSVPKVFIKDILVTTKFVNQSGYDTFYQLQYEAVLDPPTPLSEVKCKTSVTDQGNNKLLIRSDKCKDTLVTRVAVWRPNRASVSILTVEMDSKQSKDVAAIWIGFSDRQVTGRGLTIGNEKTYLHGFGLHEDSPLRGRGHDDVTMMRDFSKLQWTQANALRTSYYPYSEEFFRMADILGLAVILEIPACTIKDFGPALYKRHRDVALEIVAKYKNHPSIIMWSLANEPDSQNIAASEYFRKLYQDVKLADPSRPITFATAQEVNTDKAIQWMDVVCINRYSGWDQTAGRIDLIDYQVEKELTSWKNRFPDKPIIMTEYGGGTLIGSHKSMRSWRSDESQVKLKQYFNAFDRLRKKGILAGELIWNMVDFRVPQGPTWPSYLRKGILTREREPKKAAYFVRDRYKFLRSIANQTIETTPTCFSN